MPILTTQSARSYGLGQFVSSLTGSFYSIATISPSGTPTVSFTSIPQNFTHLQIRYIGYCTTGGTGLGESYITFNGDTTGGNYYKQRFIGHSGSTLVGQNGTVGSEGIWITSATRSSGLSMDGTVIDIHNYTDSKWKHIIARGGSGVDSTNMAVGTAGGPWISTSAINRIDITTNMGNWASGSRFGLFGVL